MRVISAESTELFDAASGPKELWIVPDAGHVDFHSIEKDTYEAKTLEFFRSNLGEEREK